MQENPIKILLRIWYNNEKKSFRSFGGQNTIKVGLQKVKNTSPSGKIAFIIELTHKRKI